MKKYISTLIIPFLISCVASHNFSSLPVTPEILNNITKRGHYLYHYDLACWVASDSVMKRNLNSNYLGTFLADTVGNKWEVVFGRVDSLGDYKVAYLVTLDSGFKVEWEKKFDPPEVLNEKWSEFGRAAGRSLVEVPEEYSSFPYNYVIFRDTSNFISVYLMPGQFKENIYLHGGDKHLTLTSGGTKIVKERRLHRSILEFPVLNSDSTTTTSTALTSTPTETDIFHVLRQNPRPTHLIIARDHIFTITPEGLIK